MSATLQPSLLRRLLLQGGAALSALVSALGALFGSGLVDDALRVAGMLANTDTGRAVMVRLLVELFKSFARLGPALAWALGLTAALALLACLPLLWRGLRRRRPSVFVSYQHEREDAAVALAQALERESFQVRRLPFDPEADHQQVVGEMQRLQRGADALVCLPGQAQSAVDAEVYAAAVLRQPVVFLVAARGGSLPNAADKRYPVMDLKIVKEQGWATVAELLHHLTQSFRSARTLYARALSHSWLLMGLAPVLAVLLLVLLALMVAAVVHGLALTQGQDGGATLLRVQSVLIGSVVVTAVALVVLAFAVATLLVSWQLILLFRAARRASLHTGEAEFRREDWLGLVPGLQAGQPLYRALMAQAPLAHHERAARAPRDRGRA